jgi:hypothetical protein
MKVFSIEMMCKIFEISESSFYAWRKNPNRPHAAKRRQILEFILEGRKDRMKQFYGSPRWTKELQAAGFVVSERYVARLMKEQGIRALKRRGTHKGLIFHSDRGVQYADRSFRKQCASHRILRSMSRKGDCWDNAVAESFFKTLKSEAIFGIPLLELNFAQRVLFEWIEISYNRRRRHSAINHLTIPEFKQSFITSNMAA